jgi:hypothetical protein
MRVYNAFFTVAHWVGVVGDAFYSWGRAIRNIYLVGAHVSPYLINISSWFNGFERSIQELAGDWYDFYRDIVDAIQDAPNLSDLLRYADDLISFIRYPFDWIIDAIRDISRDVRELFDDPIEYILETLYRYTGLGYNFIHNPRSVISGWIEDITGDVREIVNNPRGWLYDRLQDLFPDVMDFLNSPRWWIQDRIQDLFPFAYDILRDPEEFLREKIVDALEDAAERYFTRLLEIAERILQRIF